MSWSARSAPDYRIPRLHRRHKNSLQRSEDVLELGRRDVAGLDMTRGGQPEVPPALVVLHSLIGPGNGTAVYRKREPDDLVGVQITQLDRLLAVLLRSQD